jgi:hypothetical protein
MELNDLDIYALRYFLIITGFVDIISITDLLGDTRFHSGVFTKIVLSFCCILIALILAYFSLRRVGLFENKLKKPKGKK